MAAVEINDFSAPDEVRSPERTTVELVKLGRRRDRPLHVPARLALVRVHQARRRHATRARSSTSATSCPARWASSHEDGSSGEAATGSVYRIAPGHDGWVVGDEPVVVVEFQGAATYAKS